MGCGKMMAGGLHDKNERFAAWMDVMRIGNTEVAKNMHISGIHVWKVKEGKAELSDSFAWKFGQAYGFDLAQRLFSTDREPA